MEHLKVEDNGGEGRNRGNIECRQQRMISELKRRFGIERPELVARVLRLSEERVALLKNSGT